MLTVLAGALIASTPQRVDLKPLEARLTAVSQRFKGRLGIHLRLLRTGQQVGVRDQERFPSASTIKTALMVEAFRQIEAGMLKWTDQIELPPKNRRQASMWAYYMEDGLKINIDGLVALMMNYSDNTATVMLGAKLGPNNIEKTMLGFGLNDTAWTSSPPPENQRLVRLRETYANMGVTSPRDMARLLELIATGKAASPAACIKMTRIMGSQYWDDAIAWSVPVDVKVAAKVGALNRSRSDSAIVFSPDQPYVLTVYTDNQKDRRWVDENEGNAVIRQVSGIVWNYLHPRRQYTPPPGMERWYPTGGGVE